MMKKCKFKNALRCFLFQKQSTPLDGAISRSQSKSSKVTDASRALFTAVTLIGLIVTDAKSADSKNASGIPLPSGDYKSAETGRTYQLLYADDFKTDPFARPPWEESFINSVKHRSELLLNKYNIWSKYNGGPSNSQKETSWWRADNITSKDSYLSLGSFWDPSANSTRKWPGQTGRLTTSGLSASRLKGIKYGRWDMVWRAEPSDSVKYSIMLYGTGARWPEFVEVDIAEGNSNGFFSTLHYSQPAKRHVRQALIGGVKPEDGSNFATWHRLSVDFSPHRLDYYLDGKRIVSAVTASSAGKAISGKCSDLIRNGQLPDNICYVHDSAIPDALFSNGGDLGPRRFIFQTTAMKQASASSPAPAAYIDWMAIYRMNP